MALYEVAVVTSYTTRPDTSKNTAGNLIPEDIISKQSRSNLDRDLNLNNVKPTEPFGLIENPYAKFTTNPEKETVSNKYLSSVEIAESVTGFSISSISSWTNSSEPFLTNSSLAVDGFCSTKNEFEGLTFTPVSKLTLSEVMHFEATSKTKGDDLLATSHMLSKLTLDDNIGSELDLLLAKVAGDIAALQRAPDGDGIDRIVCQISNSEILNFENLPVLPFHSVDSKMDDVTTESNPYFSAVSHLSDSDVFSTAPSELNEHEDNSSSAFSSCRVSRSSSHCDLHDIASHASDDNFGDVESADHDAIVARVRKLKPRVKSRTPLPTMFTPPQTRAESGNPVVSRDTTKPLLLDLESLHSGSEMGCGRSSSGYCDSPAPSSVCSDYEYSFLNPLSKPFVPRSRINDVIAVSQKAAETSEGNSVHIAGLGSTVNYDPNVQSRVMDSGLEQTHGWNVTDCSLVNIPRQHICDDSAYPSDTHACTFHVPMNQTKSTHSVPYACCPLNPEVELPPYICKIHHGDDFVSIHELYRVEMADTFGNFLNLKKIISISQRVVKLKVNKYFSLDPFEKPNVGKNSLSKIFSYKDPEEPLFDHYGTGFAYDVDSDYVKIRTHRKVVDNAAEAKNTEVTFSLAQTGGETITICCQGIEEGFLSHAHSDSTTFTCKTPPELLKHLHLLRGVPVLRRTSMFNDSCYFSDASTDTSVSEREESSSDHMDITAELGSETQVSHSKPSGTSHQLTYAEICKKRAEFIKKNDPGRARGDGSCYAGNSETLNTTNQHEASTLKTCFTSNGIGLSESCKKCIKVDEVITRDHLVNSNHEIIKFLRRDSLIRRAFETAPDPKQEGNTSRGITREVQISSDVGHKSFTKVGELSSPLYVLEKRFNVVGDCPYSGENTFGFNGLYTNFSSYCGDVMSSHQVFPHCTTPPAFSPWSYESLVYLQSHRREAYNKQLNTGLQPSFSGDAVVSNESYGTLETGYCPILETGTKQCSDDIVVVGEMQQPMDASTQISLDSLSFTPRVDLESTNWSHNRSVKTVDQSVAFGAFREFDNVDSYLATWDKDLLNLDENLNLLPQLTNSHNVSQTQFRTEGFPFKVSPEKDPKHLIDEEFLERMVHNLTADEDHRGYPSIDGTGCCQKNYFSNASLLCHNSEPLAVIISHPHGGQKMVSRGRFSGHCHTGGDLYDVPTCMGSCGAPVIVVSDKGDELYVTQLVHAGTTRVHGISSGFGVSCFLS